VDGSLGLDGSLVNYVILHKFTIDLKIGHPIDWLDFSYFRFLYCVSNSTLNSKTVYKILSVL
jgi:hypothetical protein